VKKKKKKKKTASQLVHPGKFYQQPCWVDIWQHSCSDHQLTFWSRMNESSASVLISYLGLAEDLCKAFAARVLSLFLRIKCKVLILNGSKPLHSIA
jgi:hypothetical protein